MITEKDKKKAKLIENTIYRESRRIRSISKICATASQYNYCEGEENIGLEDLELIFDTITKSSLLIDEALEEYEDFKKG